MVLLTFAEWLKWYNCNFNVLTACNGMQAVEILKCAVIDLLITDLKMPEMDGYELLAYVAKNHPRLPVIVMTALIDSDVYKRLGALGISNYVGKPIEFNELIKEIHSLQTADLLTARSC